MPLLRDIAPTFIANNAGEYQATLETILDGVEEEFLFEVESYANMARLCQNAQGRMDFTRMYMDGEDAKVVAVFTDLLGIERFVEGKASRTRVYGTTFASRIIQGGMGRADCMVLPLLPLLTRPAESGPCTFEDDSIAKLRDALQSFKESGARLACMVFNIESQALNDRYAKGVGHVNALTLTVYNDDTLLVQHFEPHMLKRNQVYRIEGRVDKWCYGDIQAGTLESIRSAAAGLFTVVRGANACEEWQSDSVVPLHCFDPLTKTEIERWESIAAAENKQGKTLKNKRKTMGYKNGEPSRPKDCKPTDDYPNPCQFPLPEHFFFKIQDNDGLCQTWCAYYCQLRAMGRSHAAACKFMVCHRYAGLLSYIRHLLNSVPHAEPGSTAAAVIAGRVLANIVQVRGKTVEVTKANGTRSHAVGSQTANLDGMLGDFTYNEPDSTAQHYWKTFNEQRGNTIIRTQAEKFARYRQLAERSRRRWDFLEYRKDRELAKFTEFYSCRWTPVALHTLDRVRGTSDFAGIVADPDIYGRPGYVDRAATLSEMFAKLAV
jgi:hypothetical protein